MCEQSVVDYLDGDVVWVKLGNCWWPGEVVGPDKLPADVLPSFKKPPIAVVKFFQENTYEYVKNANLIFKYNCSRKNEFINKGLYMYRTKHGHMEKFPEDVIRAETAVGGDIEILTRDEFQEVKKESYKDIFGEPKHKTPGSLKKGKGRGRITSQSPQISPPRKIYIEKSDYKVYILPQKKEKAPPETPPPEPTPSTSRAGSESVETPRIDPVPQMIPSTPTATATSSGIYSCPNCSFSTQRLNVLIMHNKTHSVTYTPYTPSPVRKKQAAKYKSTPNAPKTKTPRPRKEKTETDKHPKKKTSKKRTAEATSEVEAKKAKMDKEIKSSLLADWDEDSNDDSGMILTRSPEIPIGAESPAVPTPAELSSALIPDELPKDRRLEEMSSADKSEKPEPSSDSKYEFCEDEDWPVEADAGRRIPRIKNKRKADTKSISMDEDEVAKEVAELLNKTAVPELPSVPEPLKIEENFPEPSIVKSPDKSAVTAEPNVVTTKIETKPTKAIFKTKTFFRSRHSRSQDAIGKYVAEQLNAAERMDMSESDLNGSEVASSPEARDSPPIESVKVARLAPKIQLKKMKAEAAQLREKEKIEKITDDNDSAKTNTKSRNEIISKIDFGFDYFDKPSQALQDVLYPTQEIKPINKDIPAKLHHKESKLEPYEKNIDAVDSSKSIPNVALQTSPQKNYEPKGDIAEKIFDTKIVHTSLQKDFEPKDLPENILDLNTVQTSPQKYYEPKGDTPKKILYTNLVQSQDMPDTVINVKESRFKAVYLPKKNIHITSPQKTNEIHNKIENNTVNIHTTSESIIQKVIESNIQSLDDTSPKKLEKVEGVEKVKSLVKVKITPIKKSNELQKSYNELVGPFMNESTASAVDALLSVSRETDRVPRLVGNDPPEDLFEPDNKELGTNDVLSNMSTEIIKGNGITEEQEKKKEVQTERATQDLNGESNQTSYDVAHSQVVLEDNLSSISNEEIVQDNVIEETVIENIPSESDLQIAEALINLPATAIQNKICIEHKDNLEVALEVPMEVEEEIITTAIEHVPANQITEEVVISNNNDGNIRIQFETEQEKSENLNAAQSLVQMSEYIDHKIGITDDLSLNNKDLPNTVTANQTKTTTTELKVALLSSENNNDNANGKNPKVETSSKLLKMLEEPSKMRPLFNKSPVKQLTQIKQVVVPGKEKILNFDVAKGSLKGKSQPPKQKIIIRRAGTSKGFINNLNDVVASPDKIILSRSNFPSQDGSSVQTFTIQSSPDLKTTHSDPKQIIIQPKIRKITKTTSKLQKVKPQNSLVVPLPETKTSNEVAIQDESMFDINSMPVVLSDDILTPECIEKMPIVIGSDGNLINNTPTPNPNPPKLIKSKPTIIENEKLVATPSKPEAKKLLINAVSEGAKVTTPNILSKSSKLRGAKPMLVIDKATGKQKIIMTKPEQLIKEVKPSPTLIQAVPQTAKGEKFIILPTTSSTRQGRTQKIVIDPQTGKAHVLVSKGQDPTLNVPENKPVSAKVIQTSSPETSTGNTVMIITNAQGAQSRIVLTPEHEKILFPNKNQPNLSQLKTLSQRVTTNTILSPAPKTIVSTTPVKTQTRIVPKKSAIITSKGQLIVGGRVATAAHNIAPMPEIRPGPKPEIKTAPKRIIATEPKKLAQVVQKNSSEPLIFLQQKSGAVMQLTAAQFEHLQRTGQIIQKVSAPPPENKIVVQKSITLPVAKEQIVPTISKQRVRKPTVSSTIPAKRQKQEIAIAPAPVSVAPSMPVPPLTSLSNTSLKPVVQTITSIVSSVSNTVSVETTPCYPELENFEDLLPTSAIVRQPQQTVEMAVPEVSVPEVSMPEVLVQPSEHVTQMSQPQESAAEPTPGQLSDGQLLAVPGEGFGGPPGSFYLCVEDNGTLTPIDNCPLVLENNQLVPMVIEPAPVFPAQPERRDILEAALANSDVFHADSPVNEGPDFRDLNANVSVHCRVSETSTTLNQPIMTPVEVPSKVDSEPTIPTNLEDGLAVIGVTPHSVPTSLELPITVTDPRIAPSKTIDPLGTTTYTTLMPSPTAELYVAAGAVESEHAGPISMPLLSDEGVGGKSMPILTDEVAGGGEWGAGSPASVEAEVCSRRLHTPGSDTSEASAEIPLQPAIQLSVSDLDRHS